MDGSRRMAAWVGSNTGSRGGLQLGWTSTQAATRAATVARGRRWRGDGVGAGTTDTDYNKRAGYLQEQEVYAKDDLVIEQLVLQPDFAESERRFNRSQTLRSASVASDRGGNERAVNVAKRSWFLKRGFLKNSSAKRMNNAWMTWSFQSNFMYDPVL